MSCSRCGGCLAREHALDFYNPEGQWRCINCGAHASIRSLVSEGLSQTPSRTVLPISVGQTRSKNSLLVNQRRPLQLPC